MSAPIPGFCRVLSATHHESIVATAASDTWVWIALEYGGPWAAKAYAGAMIPESVRSAIDGWVARIPGARVQLIRRRSTMLDGETHVYLGWSRPDHREVRRFRLPHVTDVPSLDVPGFVAAMARGEDPRMGERPELPVVLVCTNGKRDRCCAKWGVPVYRELSRRADVDVWQTTHLGGHRFAATLLTLPDGLCYGRIEVDEIDDFALSLQRGRIHRLDRFRGRTALPSAGQAAEHFHRERLGRLEVDAVRAVSVEPVSKGWRAAVLDDAGREYRVTMQRETLAEHAPPSCGKPAEPIHRWSRMAVDEDR
jgi:hypothetical protein